MLCDVTTGGDVDVCDDDSEGGEGGVSTAIDLADCSPFPSLGIISNPLSCLSSRVLDVVVLVLVLLVLVTLSCLSSSSSSSSEGI